MPGSIISYDKDLAEIPGQWPWESPTSFFKSQVFVTPREHTLHQLSSNGTRAEFDFLKNMPRLFLLTGSANILSPPTMSTAEKPPRHAGDPGRKM